MVILERTRNLPLASLLFFLPTTFLLFVLHRFVEPFPSFLFYPSFFLQFSFSFFPQLYSRKWGRIFTAVGAILLCRIAWFSDPLQSIAPTGLIGLFLGSISGIWIREILLVFLGRQTAVLPRQSDRFFEQWMIRNPASVEHPPLFFQGPFFLVYFAFLLLANQFLLAFGISWKEGLGLPEFLFFPGVSSREYLGQPVLFATSVILPLLYFLSEERASPSTNKSTLYQHLFFGLGIGIFIQFIFLILQVAYIPDFFSAGSNLSLVVNRTPGLFVDSGSASWILPTLSFLILQNFYKRWKIQKEKIMVVPMIVFILGNAYIGLRLGKVFWIIWFVLGLAVFFQFVSMRLETLKNKKRILLWKILLYCGLPLLFFSLLGLSSFLPKGSSIQRLGDLFLGFVQTIASGKFWEAWEFWDGNRFRMMLIGWENFNSEPLWGHGWGSYLMSLKDPDRVGTQLSEPFFDTCPNFYLGILQDLGLYGTFLFCLLIAFTIWERNSFSYSLLLVVPFFFGTQVQHADGAFLAVFLCMLSRKGMASSFLAWKQKKWFLPSVSILALCFPLHICIHFYEKAWEEGIGADFRKDKLGFYQIGAFEWAGFSGNPNHKFQGKVWEWKTKEFDSKRKARWEAIAEIPKETRVQIFFLDKDKQPLPAQESLTVLQNSLEWKGNIPKGTEYIRVAASSNIRFQMKKKDFDSENRFIWD